MHEDQLTLTRKRVRRLRDFYVHLAMFVVVIGGLAVLNWVFTPTFWWVLFPAAGWGIGIVAHAISVLFEDSLFSPSWEERKTRELLEREGGHAPR